MVDVTYGIELNEFNHKEWDAIYKAHVLTYFYPKGTGKKEFQFYGVGDRDRLLTDKSGYIRLRSTNMSCCGMAELGYFPCNESFSEEMKARLIKFDELYQGNIDRQYNYLLDDGEECDEDEPYPDPNASMLICCTLSEDQSRWWKEVEAIGFELTKTWTNINSGNEVRLYMKEYKLTQ